MAIQFKRGTTEKIKQSSDTLLPGQPLVDLDTGELYIGLNDGDSIKDLSPITTSNILSSTGKNSLSQSYRDNTQDYSAVASGINSAAFGGKRFDMLDDPHRSATSAEGNQSFAAGGSTHAIADFTTAMGKDGIAYQKGSFTAAMKGQSGLSEEEFNSRYWDSVSNVPLHDGKGKDTEGNILNEFGKTYINSYSTATSFGDENKAKGYADFASGLRNVSYGQGNFTIGIENNVDAIEAFTGGERNEIGDVTRPFTFGHYLRNKARDGKTVIGKFNYDDATNVFEIGGGTGQAAAERKNIFGIKDDGSVWASGTITAEKAPEHTSDVVRLNELNQESRQLCRIIAKDPSQTYLIWIASQFPASSSATFTAPEGSTINWGDGNIEKFTASHTYSGHKYTDGISCHIISITGLTSLVGGAFHNCTGLAGISLSDDVIDMSWDAFAYCDKLENVHLGNGLTNIGYQAFAYCTSLKELTLPESVNRIDKFAFRNATNLKVLHVDALTPPTLDIKSFTDSSVNQCVVSRDVIQAYESSDWLLHNVGYDVCSNNITDLIRQSGTLWRWNVRLQLTGGRTTVYFSYYMTRSSGVVTPGIYTGRCKYEYETASGTQLCEGTAAVIINSDNTAEIYGSVVKLDDKTILPIAETLGTSYATQITTELIF